MATGNESVLSGQVVGKPAETLSQFLARILDQLSVSSWLPSSFLVSASLLYGNLAVNDGDLGRAIQNIGGLDAGPMVMLFVAVVLTTVIAQAFEFEAIRLLEGYWKPGRLRRIPSLVGCRLHRRRLSKLEERRRDLKVSAHSEIAVALADRPIDCRAAQALLLGQSLDDIDRKTVSRVKGAGWRAYAKPGTVREFEAVDLALERLPSMSHRILPTRLGNVLRAFEERAEDPNDGPLEGMVQRVFHRLPVSLQLEHDQFRSRLDLYCSMTLLAVLSALVGAVVLMPTGVDEALVAVTVNGLLAWLFYRGAVASAAAYGQVLVSIRDYMDEESPTSDAES